MTEILRATKEALEKASQYLLEGELVVFPTETVYGLGADGLNEEACAKIFEAKQRPQDNPLILHISHLSMLDSLVELKDGTIRKAMEDLWPGPLTLIFKKKEIIPDIVTAKGDTVAIRMPSHQMARQLIGIVGRPLAAPSANRSGRPSPTKASDVYEDMKGIVPLILDGGSCQIGIESTVVDTTQSPAMILRPGAYTPEDLDPYFPGILIDQGLLNEGEQVKSPGQKYKHYAPKAEMYSYLGERKKVIEKIKEDLDYYKKLGKKVGLLLFQEDAFQGADLVLSHGSINHIEEMAHSLFANLREMDRQAMDVILCQAFEDEEKGLSLSIMNRLRKASSGHIKKI